MRDTSVAGHLHQIWPESCSYSVNMAFKLSYFGLLERPSTVQQGIRKRLAAVALGVFLPPNDMMAARFVVQKLIRQHDREKRLFLKEARILVEFN